MWRPLSKERIQKVNIFRSERTELFFCRERNFAKRQSKWAFWYNKSGQTDGLLCVRFSRILGSKHPVYSQQPPSNSWAVIRDGSRKFMTKWLEKSGFLVQPRELIPDYYAENVVSGCLSSLTGISWRNVITYAIKSVVARTTRRNRLLIDTCIAEILGFSRWLANCVCNKLRCKYDVLK